MAGKSYLSKPTYRFFFQDKENPPKSNTPAFEFDESDLWNSHFPQSEMRSESKKTIPSSRISKKSTNKAENSSIRAGEASSLPVEIPDWSKMRNPQRKELIGGESDNDDDGEGDGARIPPHEFLAKQSARTRTASFSVHEGIGRTLKGRDLSRVRNAVWQKIGFED